METNSCQSQLVTSLRINGIIETKSHDPIGFCVESNNNNGLNARHSNPIEWKSHLASASLVQ